MLPKCTFFFDDNGKKKTMSNLDYDRIEKIINNFANKSLRTVLLAYADLNDFRDYKQENFDNFNFLAIVGLKDPLRPEIPQAVK